MFRCVLEHAVTLFPPRDSAQYLVTWLTLPIRFVSLEQVANERLIGYTLADYPEYHLLLATLFAPLKRVPRIAEEHDSSTSLIAAVEAGRGVALVQQGFDCLSGPRLRVRPLNPAPPPAVVGIAYRKGANSPATAKFVAAAKRAK